MPKVLTIGETMAAMVPDCALPLRYVNGYGIRTAGAESNTAVGLSKLGVEASFFTRLGEDELGYFIKNSLRAEGVDCSSVLFDREHRTGVMFKETSARETKVYYYRENSAASHMQATDLTDAVFSGCELLHISGITPILSDTCREMTDFAYSEAERRGMLISFDPNIRKKLWRDNDYAPFIRGLAEKSDILLLGREEALTLFKTDDFDELCDLVFRSGTKYLALKDGENGALVAKGDERIKIPPYPCKPIDPVGAGDGFNAGFLAGILTGRSLEAAGRMGALCGALATETTGDVEGYPDLKTLEALLSGDGILYR